MDLAPFSAPSSGPSSRAVALALSLLTLAACGGAPPPSAGDARNAPDVVSIHVVPFSATLPNGTVVALDELGRITVDEQPVATLRPDGRVVSPEGETIAALLSDGQVSYAGNLIGSTVRDARLLEGGVAVLEIADDRTLTIRNAQGQALASVPILGVTPDSRDTAVFVLTVHVLESMRLAGGAARERLAELDAAAGIVRMRVPVEGHPSRGPATAPVTIAVFSDFQCPFCSRVVPTLETLREEYGDRLRIVFFHHPLPFHDRADEAAVVASEAFAQRGAQGFWQMHDILFENQRALGTSELLAYARQVGLDTVAVQAALDEGRHRDAIDADAALGARLGARGTPGFFINGVLLLGAQPIEVFREQIDRELARAEQLRALGVRPDQLYALLMEGAREDAPEEPAPAPSPPRPQPDPAAVYRVPLDGRPARGPADALVTIVVFSDFECPFCARVRPTLERIEEHYGRDVRLVYRHNPLPFHTAAMPAAEAAAEAYAQGGAAAFWRMHDLLFENRSALERADLERYAREIGLDAARFARALDRHTHRAAIEEDQALARQLGASGTPAFFVNGRNLRGAQPFEAFQALIDEELARARARVASGTPRRRVYEALTRDGATAPVMLPAPGGAAPGGDAADDDRVYVVPVPARAPSRGDRRAPVTIQIFSDFQCPFCARVRGTVDRILEHYAGRVRLVWRNYPLPFHTSAELAAEAAMEVYAQLGDDAFWRFHDILFENQRALERADLEGYARQIPGIDPARFGTALDDHRHRAAIRADVDAVRAAGAEIGTPSFFVGGHLVQGAQPFETFQAAIDRALSAGDAAGRD